MGALKNHLLNHHISLNINEKTLENHLIQIRQYTSKIEFEEEDLLKEEDLEWYIGRFWAEFDLVQNLDLIPKKILRKLPDIYFIKNKNFRPLQLNDAVNQQVLKLIKSSRGPNFTKKLYRHFLNNFTNVENKALFFTVFESYFQNDKSISSQNIFTAHRQFQLLSEDFFDVFSFKVLEVSASIEMMYSRLGLKEAHLTSDFMQQAFKELNIKCSKILEEPKLSTICSFYLSKKDLLDPTIKKTFIKNVLHTFREKRISYSLFVKNFELLVKDTFKDPRRSPGTWIGFETEKRIYLSWKVSQTMGAFFDLIDKSCEDNESAGKMWKPRRKILKALLDQGFIHEAWFILGPTALKDSVKYLPEGFNDFAKLTQTDSERTIILIRVGNHIIAEGTYNFAFRIWEIESKYAPKMYLETYRESDITYDSADVKVNHNVTNWVAKISPILSSTLGINIKL